MATTKHQRGGDHAQHVKAGRAGGSATAKKHGPEFYREIGEKGGQATANKHGRSFYQKIGSMGGKERAKDRK